MARIGVGDGDVYVSGLRMETWRLDGDGFGDGYGLGLGLESRQRRLGYRWG